MRQRRIVNGTDKARMIAGYAQEIDAQLKAAGYGVDKPKPIPVPEPAPKAQPAPAGKQGGLMGLVIAIIVAAATAAAGFFLKGVWNERYRRPHIPSLAFRVSCREGAVRS